MIFIVGFMIDPGAQALGTPLKNCHFSVQRTLH